MFIDIHTHTFPNSDDSFMSPDELVDGAKASGLDAICITDHDYFWDPADIIDLSARHDFLVLPGAEVNTDQGHVLVFGLERYVFGMHKATTLHRLVHQAGGVMVAAHPYRRRYQREQAGKPDSYRSMVDSACADQLLPLCDAIEVLNGRATDGESAFSVDVTRRLGLGMAGASDAHRLEQLGTAATWFDNPVACLDDLITEIKQVGLVRWSC